ncbi:MAG: SLBB domain-containing protein [Parachlamydiaceae bacterium]|nr:SLBB domain-containing protein [Parachlamydiaceae bacterium]
MEQEEKKHLPFYEWLVILLFCLILLVISLFAWLKPSSAPSWNESHTTNSTKIKEQGILTVTISGAVEFPGAYDLPIKSTIQDLLNKVKPLPEANLSKVKQKSKLKNLQQIQIPYKKWLTIIIEGAIENPGPFQILEGTRYPDLIKLLNVLPEGDIKPLNRKKGLIREGEVIKIHSKDKVFNHEK